MATKHSEKMTRTIRTGHAEVGALPSNTHPLAEPGLPKPLSDNITALIQEMRTNPTAEIDKLISKLQAERKHLEVEGERLVSEATRCMELNQSASASINVIVESLSEWRKAELQRSKLQF